MGSKFRLNRYNWFGQKLLAQHEYSKIQRLHQYLVLSNQDNEQQAINSSTSGMFGDTTSSCSSVRSNVSEHLSYIHGLALMKTSTRLDEVIFSLQRLNFDKNSQYFLLLCQCLLYLGNYDSVVALCKQIIDKEIDAVGSGNGASISDQLSQQDNAQHQRQSSEEGIDLINLGFGSTSSQDININNKEEKRRLCLEESIGRQESSEFKRVFANINRNNLINEPRLWFIFGLCLEYQRHHKDAYFAYKVASKLSSGNILANQQLMSTADVLQSSTNQVDNVLIGGIGSSSNEIQSSVSNYYAPHTKYAEFSIRLKEDFKTAIQTLSQASIMFPHNYTLNPMLALAISAQPVSSNHGANSNKAIKLITSLENHSASNRNPSLGYNRLALKAKRKSISSIYNSMVALNSGDQCSTAEAGDENRLNLSYLLIKGHIMLNSCLDSSSSAVGLHQTKHDQKSSALATSTFTATTNSTAFASAVTLSSQQADRLIETLRESDLACWASASLWNNLGLCYLIKKKFIACLSCLMKAYSINPLDWRINYNLSVACMQVGLVARALVCLFAARNLYATTNRRCQQQQTICASYIVKAERLRVDPLIITLLAICYDKLGEVDESRRLHIGTTRHQKSNLSNIPVNSLVNYLIFLHNNPDHADEQHIKLKSHLLDQLEQCWLQRNLNDHQFNGNVLAIASRIGDEIFTKQSQLTRKTYAWTKTDPLVKEHE